MMLRPFAILFTLLSLSGAAVAMQPTITPLDIGAEAGKPVTCDGHLYVKPALSNEITPCGNDKSTTCYDLMIEACPLRKDVDFVECNGVALTSAQADTLRAHSIEPGDTDINLELIRRGVKRSDAGWEALYHQLVADKIALKPAVRVRGILASCTTCPECYPRSECALSACTIEPIAPTPKK